MSARKGLPQHQINYPVSQSYIYQTPLVHDSLATRTQSSSENLVSQTSGLTCGDAFPDKEYVFGAMKCYLYTVKQSVYYLSQDASFP